MASHKRNKTSIKRKTRKNKGGNKGKKTKKESERFGFNLYMVNDAEDLENHRNYINMKIKEIKESIRKDKKLLSNVLEYPYDHYTPLMLMASTETGSSSEPHVQELFKFFIQEYKDHILNLDKEEREQKYNDFINAKTEKFPFTPLHIAVRDLNYDIARILLENGADVNSHGTELVYGAKEQTPLHFAVSRIEAYDRRRGVEIPEHEVEKRIINICELLFEYGADVFAKDKNGKTPLDIAKRPRDYSHEMLKGVVDFLKEKEEQRGMFKRAVILPKDDDDDDEDIEEEEEEEEIDDYYKKRSSSSSKSSSSKSSSSKSSSK